MCIRDRYVPHRAGPAGPESVPASAVEPASLLQGWPLPIASPVHSCARLRSCNPVASLPAPAVCSEPVPATSCSALSTPSVPAVDADPYGEATWLADGVRAADPAWLPPVAGQDRAMPRSLHREPTPRSDLRNDDCVPASTRHADRSLPGLRASSEPGSEQPPRTLHPAASVASKVRSQLARLHSTRADARGNQACG